VLGSICPSFFLLPLARGELLGVPIYESWEAKRKCPALQIGNWKDDEWPTDHILHYYGPATWAEDGSWGHHTSIIRLQAVVEIMTNETARALNLLAKQSIKMHNAIYQNCLALDYLLASKGGVCGKFNLSNCCLQIDDEGKVIEVITALMRKIKRSPMSQSRPGKSGTPGNYLGDGFQLSRDSKPS
jgi:hypothetical protein